MRLFKISTIFISVLIIAASISYNPLKEKNKFQVRNDIEKNNQLNDAVFTVLNSEEEAEVTLSADSISQLESELLFTGKTKIQLNNNKTKVAFTILTKDFRYDTKKRVGYANDKSIITYQQFNTTANRILLDFVTNKLTVSRVIRTRYEK